MERTSRVIKTAEQLRFERDLFYQRRMARRRNRPYIPPRKKENGASKVLSCLVLVTVSAAMVMMTSETLRPAAAVILALSVLASFLVGVFAI